MKLTACAALFLFSTLPPAARALEPAVLAPLLTVKTGDPAPGFDAEFLKADAAALADFGGQVVLLAFFRTTSKPCSAEIEKLNELESKYTARGFAVVAVTNEPKKVVAEAVEREKREHAVAVVKGDKVEKLYGVIATPHALLVDAGGKIVWTGALSEIDVKELEGLLADVVPLVSDKYPDARKAMRRQQYDEAVEAIDRALATAPDDKELLATKSAIEAVLQRRLDQAKVALDAHKYAEAAERYAQIDASFGFLPAAAGAKNARAAIEKDPAAKDDLAAWKLYERAQAKAVAGDDDKAVLEWQALIKKYPQTKTAERAKVALRQRGR